jgi:RNA polymerase sigma-70 factor (ECF subfamily)
MLGDPCDGEDVLQEALALAFYRLSELRAGDSLRPWLFRIAHNKCIDFLRRRRRFELLDRDPVEDARTMDDKLEQGRRAARALVNIATDLPPKERACVVLKDILDCSLEETADITGSNVGAVKAALHRGRERLEQAERMPPRDEALDPAQRALAERYIAAFNRRDWDAVRSFLSDEARLEVVHAIEGPFRDAPYFTNYGKLTWTWRLALAYVDGVECIVHFREADGVWSPHAIVQLAIEDGVITRVRDYVHVDYLLKHSDVQEADEL